VDALPDKAPIYESMKDLSKPSALKYVLAVSVFRPGFTVKFIETPFLGEKLVSRRGDILPRGDLKIASNSGANFPEINFLSVL